MVFHTSSFVGLVGEKRENAEETGDLSATLLLLVLHRTD
jgi:hypothetical protein